MNDDGRIDPVSIARTVPRQTPKDEFGALMATAAQKAVAVGGALVGSIASGQPVLSAAVAGTQAVTSMAAAVTQNGTPPSGADGGTSGTGGELDLLREQRALMLEGQKFNAAYLSLQNEMQRESREFTALSNILKVRHDTAKSAINNIR